MLDEEGNICNGDVIILLIAKYLEAINQLNNKVVVSTVMANYGFKNSMDKNNFKNIETKAVVMKKSEQFLNNVLNI